MEIHSLPTEVILSSSHVSLGYLTLDWDPQPGTSVEVKDQTYVVLERRHRYQLWSGRYRLHKIALYVQPIETLLEQRFLNGQWVIGDITCSYNARSPLIRCVVNPCGPCDRCIHYQSMVDA